MVLGQSCVLTVVVVSQIYTRDKKTQSRTPTLCQGQFPGWTQYYYSHAECSQHGNLGEGPTGILVLFLQLPVNLQLYQNGFEKPKKSTL